MNNTMVWFTWAMQMQKQTHAQENTVLLKGNNRNDDRFYVLGIGTWLALHLHRTLFNLSDANAWTKASWNMFFYQVGMQDAQSIVCAFLSMLACALDYVWTVYLHFCLCGSCYLVLYILRVFMMQQFEKLLQH